MNILFIIGKYPNYGGTERMTTILANSLAKRGHCIHIASFEQPKPELAEELDRKTQLYNLTYPVLSASNERILNKIIDNNGIDLIINQWCLHFNVTRLINKARKNKKTKLISVLHGVPNRSKRLIVIEDKIKNSTGFRKTISKMMYKLVDGAIRLSLRYVYRNSDKYVLLSPSFIDAFCSYAKQKERNKLMAIGNPITVDTEFSQTSLLSKEKMILYVGRMDVENKRVNRIIEAWEECYKKFPDWKLILVGDGPHKKQLETYVECHGISNVEFTGFLKEDPIEYYKKASILLLTSDLEGFGLVIVEGMSFGVVPIVYGSYDAVYDIIENGKTGIITPMPYKIENTVKALTGLMADENQRYEMAEKVIEEAKRFRLDDIVDKWEKLFFEIIN